MAADSSHNFNVLMWNFMISDETMHAATFAVENYTKGETKRQESDPPLTMHESVVHMKVNYGSKIQNLMGFAIKKMKEEPTRQLTWNGEGHAISKVVSCAEIMKRRIKGLHQITDIRYNRIEEYWDPKDEQLERLKVNRDVPAITVLLSKDELDVNHPSYQAPGVAEPFSARKTSAPPPQQTSRRGKKKHAQQGDNNSDFTAPSLDRKRKRKGGGQGGQPGTDSAKKGGNETGRNRQRGPKDKQNQNQQKSASQSRKQETSGRNEQDLGGNQNQMRKNSGQDQDGSGPEKESSHKNRQNQSTQDERIHSQESSQSDQLPRKKTQGTGKSANHRQQEGGADKKQTVASGKMSLSDKLDQITNTKMDDS